MLSIDVLYTIKIVCNARSFMVNNSRVHLQWKYGVLRELQEELCV
jgi:hypothetical protein